MANQTYLQAQYPGFVTDAFNAYQPKFLQSLMAGQPLTPITGGEQDVIQQGRDFTSNPISNPLFSSYSTAMTNLLQPQQEVARRNLADTYRQAGAGTLQSGAFAKGAADLERDLFTNTGDLISKGYAQLYPAIGNQLNNQAGLEALPRLQQEKTIGYLQSLLGAKNQATGLKDSTGEQIAEFLSGPLAAILGGSAGSLGGSIGKGIGDLLKSAVGKITGMLGGSDTSALTQEELNALNYADQAFSDDFSGLQYSGGDGGGLGNYANFDFSGLGDGTDWSFGNDFANMGDWGFDFSNFSNASGDLGASDAVAGDPLGFMDSAGGAGDLAGGFDLSGIGGLGSLASLGVGGLMKAFDAPPMAASGVGTMMAAALSSTPWTMPLAFLGPLIGMKPGETENSFHDSVQMIQSSMQNIKQATDSGQPVSPEDMRTAGVVMRDGDNPHGADFLRWATEDILARQARGEDIPMSGGNYVFNNIQGFIHGDSDYGIKRSDDFIIPTISITPEQLQGEIETIRNEDTEWRQYINEYRDSSSRDRD